MLIFGVQKLGYRLHDLYDIPYNQFEFESYCWHKREEERIKEYQYQNFLISWAPHRDPKQLPRTFDQFRGVEPKVSEGMMDWFRADMKKFKDAQKRKPTN